MTNSPVAQLVDAEPVEPQKRGRGRPRGSMSATTRALEDTLQRLRCDPATALARMVNNTRNPVEVRMGAAKALMPYVYPQRKAVEISSDSEPFIFVFGKRADG